jgi:flagellar basal body-associated protein FliL
LGTRVGDEIIMSIEPPKLQANKTSVAIVVVLLILTYFLLVVVVVGVVVVVVLEYLHNFHCWFSFGFVLHCTNNSCLFLLSNSPHHLMHKNSKYGPSHKEQQQQYIYIPIQSSSQQASKQSNQSSHC